MNDEDGKIVAEKAILNLVLTLDLLHTSYVCFK